MESINFLQSELKSISESFPQVHIKYSFNRIISTHIVELLPIEEYKNNSSLDDAWIPLSFKFRELFPEDEISFISSDSNLCSDGTIFEYNAPVVFTEEELIDELFSTLTENTLHYDFPTEIPEGRILRPSPVDLLKYPVKYNNNIKVAESTYSQAA